MGSSPAKSLLLLCAMCGLAVVPASSARLVAQPAQEGPSPGAGSQAVRANINITPKRLTFDPGERTATAYIFNQGTAPATFDITIVDRVMLPSGEIEPVSEAEKNPALQAVVGRLNSAKDLLIATPRRATLQPGRGQLIRIRVKSPPREGREYRSHLTVTTIPPRDLGLTAEQAATAASGNQLSFQIASLYGISIPVILRAGAPEVSGKITGVQLSYTNFSANGGPMKVPVLSFELERTGKNSLYGNIEVRGARSKAVYAIARGVGVYTEIGSRRIQLPLQRAPANEQLEIRFIDDDVAPGRVIAESTYVVH